MSLADIFNRLSAAYPQIFPPTAFAPLQSHFGHWPEVGLSALGFEIRLDGDRTVDLSGLITDPRAAHVALQSLAPAGWQPLLSLLSAWDSQWREQFYNAWFEFDAAQTRPMPAVFLQRCMPKGRTNGALAETFAALSLIAGAIAPEFVAATGRAESHVCYVGALLSRADGLYRLALPATHANMTDVLALLGWRGDAPALNAVLAELVPAHPGQTYGLDVDWREDLLDKIGIDITMPRLPLMVPWLHARGLIETALVPVLLALPSVSHLKLVFDRDRLVQAKAYLRYNFSHDPRHRV